MKIYTRSGDGGTSSLYNGERRQKDDAVFAALGDVDELNSAIGVARQYLKIGVVDGGGSILVQHKESSSDGSVKLLLRRQLEEVQSRLLDVGSSVATPLTSSTEAKVKRVSFGEGHVQDLEKWIDSHTSTLPPLTNFILPSGGFAASHLHLARAICRRAERAVVSLMSVHDQEDTDPQVAVYLNRLSDYLFTIARVAAREDGEMEVVYQK